MESCDLPGRNLAPGSTLTLSARRHGVLRPPGRNPSALGRLGPFSVNSL